MAYVDQFQHADDIVTHLNSIVRQIGTTNPLLAAKYTGFVSIAGVTVYELAIKDIFTEFARKKHKTFGHFVDEHFNRINGRIKLQVIRDDYISRFGKKYKERFERKIQKGHMTTSWPITGTSRAPTGTSSLGATSLRTQVK